MTESTDASIFCSSGSTRCWLTWWEGIMLTIHKALPKALFVCIGNACTSCLWDDCAWMCLSKFIEVKWSSTVLLCAHGRYVLPNAECCILGNNLIKQNLKVKKMLKFLYKQSRQYLETSNINNVFLSWGSWGVSRLLCVTGMVCRLSLWGSIIGGGWVLILLIGFYS